MKFGIHFVAILIATLSLTSGATPNSVDYHTSEEWADYDEWLRTPHEPWEYELVGLWPDVEKMISIVYPVAQQGNTRAQLAFSYFVSLLRGLPGQTLLGEHSLVDLRDQALLWMTSLSKSGDVKTARIAEFVLEELAKEEDTQSSTPDLLP